MLIDPKLCIGCGICVPYCPVEAIITTDTATAKNKKIRAIKLDDCVECGACRRVAICPTDAIVQQPLEWPRSLRSAFSNPLTEHKSKDMGRGTEEIKTNEITHRFQKGQVGYAIEMGRPLLGTGFPDVEKVTRAMARVGVEFEPRNPLAELLEDGSTGVLRKDIMGEKVLSIIVEFRTGEDKVEQVLSAVREVANRIDTVFSMSVIRLLSADGRDPVLDRIRSQGFKIRPNGKVNLGLGRAIPNDSRPAAPGRVSPSEGRLP